jgi:phage-related baseplate assembly protein
VAAGAELLDALDTFIQERKMITVQHNVLAGNLQGINVTATISVLPGFSFAEIEAALEADFQELFNSDEFQKLDVVRRFDLFTILCRAEGVQFADLITPTADITLTPDEAAIIGALDIQQV